MSCVSWQQTLRTSDQTGGINPVWLNTTSIRAFYKYSSIISTSNRNSWRTCAKHRVRSSNQHIHTPCCPLVGRDEWRSREGGLVHLVMVKTGTVAFIIYATCSMHPFASVSDSTGRARYCTLSLSSLTHRRTHTHTHHRSVVLSQRECVQKYAWPLFKEHKQEAQWLCVTALNQPQKLRCISKKYRLVHLNEHYTAHF